MTSGTMTILTKLRDSSGQHGAMITAMDAVTDDAIFGNRLMLYPEWTSFFSMAGETEFVDAVGLDHFFSKAPMGIVTIGAAHSAFLDRMMRLSVRHHSDLLVATEAEFRLALFQTLVKSAMDRVTVITGDPRRLMPAIVPKGEVA